MKISKMTAMIFTEMRHFSDQRSDFKMASRTLTGRGKLELVLGIDLKKVNNILRSS